MASAARGVDVPESCSRLVHRRLNPTSDLYGSVGHCGVQVATRV